MPAAPQCEIPRKSNKKFCERSRSRVGWIEKAFRGLRESKNLMVCFKDKSVAIVDPRTIVLMKKGLRIFWRENLCKAVRCGWRKERETEKQKIFFCSVLYWSRREEAKMRLFFSFHSFFCCKALKMFLGTKIIFHLPYIQLSRRGQGNWR